MNRFGLMALEHWRTNLPRRFSTVQDPETYFRQVGELAQQRIEDLAADLAGDDPAGEGYLEKLGRLNMARLQAEETVVREDLLPDPEQDGDLPPATSQQWIPVTEDPNHPHWQDLADRTETD